MPTGTVLLRTTILYSSMARPMPSATARTCDMSAEPSSLVGVPTAMKRIFDCRNRVVEIRREAQTFFVYVPLHELRKPRLVDRDFATLQAINFLFIDIDGDNMVPVLGETSRYDEADITRSYN